MRNLKLNRRKHYTKTNLGIDLGIFRDVQIQLVALLYGSQLINMSQRYLLSIIQAGMES